MKTAQKDTRDKLWKKFEHEIQAKGTKKDPHFRISGIWKKFLRKQNEMKIYVVDGTWIRNNLCVYFGHGGHGLVHEFIPNNEIWISTHHYDESAWNGGQCGCTVRGRNQAVSKKYFESTIIHEMAENKFMNQGKSFWTAHQLALKEEIKIGLLKDPFDDT